MSESKDQAALYFVVFNDAGLMIERHALNHSEAAPDHWKEITEEFFLMMINENTVDWVLNADGSITSRDRLETPEDAMAKNSAKLQAATQLASTQKADLANRIGVIQDAVDLDMATPEEEVELPARESQLTVWKKYAILLGRVTAQEGWPVEIQWPESPMEGIGIPAPAVRDSPAPTQ